MSFVNKVCINYTSLCRNSSDCWFREVTPYSWMLVTGHLETELSCPWHEPWGLDILWGRWVNICYLWMQSWDFALLLLWAVVHFSYSCFFCFWISFCNLRVSWEHLVRWSVHFKVSSHCDAFTQVKHNPLCVQMLALRSLLLWIWNRLAVMYSWWTHLSWTHLAKQFSLGG